MPVVVWLVALPAFGLLDFFAGSSFFRPVGLLLIASVVGGAMAGGASGTGWRGRAAFAVAFVALLWVPLLAVSALPALGGKETLRELAIGLAPGFALAYGLIGALGAALDGSDAAGSGAAGGWPRVATTGLVFGAAGLLGGLLVALVASLSPGATGLSGFAISLLGGAVCLIASAAGGWWMAGASGPSGR